MRISHRFRLALAAAALLTGGTLASAESSAELDVVRSRPTLSGSYLAARSADKAKDMAAAMGFYGDTLANDPDNPGLMERVLLLGLANGDMNPSFALAKRLIKLDSGNPASRVALAVSTIKQNLNEAALANLDGIARADLASLTAGLMKAWIEYGDGKTDEAITTIAGLRGPEWYGIFKDYHTALILDAAGRSAEAVEAIKRAYKSDTTALRIVDGYARIMTRAGNRDEAIKALVAFGGRYPLHPAVRELLDQIRSGKTPEPTATTTTAGVSELLYGLGSAIGLEDGPDLSAAYLRLAAYLDPKAFLVTMAIGDVFRSVGRCEEAIAIYETVPNTASMRRNADIQIGTCLQTIEKHDEAARYIRRVVDANPKDVEAAVELGNVYRSDNRFAEAADAYTIGINAVSDAQDADWRVYYFRGVSFERSDRWPEAERDFKQALAINPDQPQVLNYLGYSWVDKGMNFDEALKMIQKAVDLRPNDGYIVDSLGWAYYQLGRRDQAVTALETAVELRADDPVINDHLGDAYWTVGRKREALFQWAHARDLGPEKDALPKILAKLEHGLDGAGRENTVAVEKGESLWDIALRVYGDAALYERILQANKDKINDPNLIYPGMMLVIPAPETN
ncbi:MAG: tetratricopeptide repeat protein [Bauldia sp.]|nr:tetratricopeptide repeat protein [Bauldia sp.]